MYEIRQPGCTAWETDIRDLRTARRKLKHAPIGCRIIHVMGDKSEWVLDE